MKGYDTYRSKSKLSFNVSELTLALCQRLLKKWQRIIQNTVKFGQSITFFKFLVNKTLFFKVYPGQFFWKGGRYLLLRLFQLCSCFVVFLNIQQIWE